MTSLESGHGGRQPTGSRGLCLASWAGAGGGTLILLSEQRGQEAREEVCSWYQNLDHRLSGKLRFI